ncbi:uncharacterized protein LOC126900508 [Daktulosphaira vitifoliae]|uniref:uncharacterized protein LOC126900508 n=1 Tax=Daktulosphaira vitifoliae TaxID=58002 RepID=UPI0021AA4584|nr:uncharacterized protein LOC126900508 [Daktulosphaira vitifoliae]
MYELLKEILECIEYVSDSVENQVAELLETWDRCSRTYAGVVEKINVAWKAPLDIDLLNEFPDIRMKVAKKLEWLGNEQLGILQLFLNRFYQINECLKKKLDNINLKLEHISFENHMEIKHTVRDHTLWLEECWVILHCLFMQLEFSIISLKPNDEDSAKKMVEAAKQDEKDKYSINKINMYKQSCISLLKFLENQNKIKLIM